MRKAFGKIDAVGGRDLRLRRTLRGFCRELSRRCEVSLGRVTDHDDGPGE